MIDIRKNNNFFPSNLTKIYKLTDMEIGFLIDNDFLVKKGKKFVLSPIIDIREFGLELLSNHKPEEARMCFEICYKFVSNHKKLETDKEKSDQEKERLAKDNKLIYLQYLLSKLKNQQYDNIYEVLINLRQCFTEKDKNEYDLYVYLLSFIVDFPEEDLEDVLEAPDTVNLIGLMGSEEEICSFIKNASFKEAFKLVEKSKTRGTYDVDFEVLRILLDIVVAKEKEFKERLGSLAKNKEYEEIRTLLLNRQKLRRLNAHDTRVLLIVSTLMDLLENGIYPKIVKVSCMYEYPKELVNYDLTDALINNEIKVAVAMNTSYVRYNMDDEQIENNAISILLKELYSRMQNIGDIDMKEIEKLSNVLSVKEIDLGNSGLSIGDICLVRLVRAIDCYKEGLVEYGDKLIGHVNNNYWWATKNDKLSYDMIFTIEKKLKEARIAREEAIIKFSKDGVLMAPKGNCSLLLRR